MAGPTSIIHRPSSCGLIPVLLVMAISACGPLGAGDGSGMPEATIRPTATFVLATPVSQEPAAGICGSSGTEVIEATIYPDIPDPRCAQVRAEQVLRVVNRTEGPLEVRIGPFAATVEPGGEYTLDVPFGDYLAPGVHSLLVLPCCGPELWLQAGGG